MNNNNYQNSSNNDYSGMKELWDQERHMPEYNKDLVFQFHKVMKRISPNQGRYVLDFGAGIGVLASIWRSNFGVSPLCVEIDDLFCAELRKRNFSVEKSLTHLDGHFDFAYTSNVLEHIEDDVTALSHIKRSLSENGLLVIYVPAFPILYSGLDRKVGHFRRYSKKELIDKVEQAGFVVLEVRFNDSLGFFSALMTRFIGYNNKTGLGSPKSLLMYDKWIYPASRVLDILFFNKWFGKNLFLIAINKCEAK